MTQPKQSKPNRIIKRLLIGLGITILVLGLLIGAGIIGVNYWFNHTAKVRNDNTKRDQWGAITINCGNQKMIAAPTWNGGENADVYSEEGFKDPKQTFFASALVNSSKVNEKKTNFSDLNYFSIGNKDVPIKDSIAVAKQYKDCLKSVNLEISSQFVEPSGCYLQTPKPQELHQNFIIPCKEFDW